MSCPKIVTSEDRTKIWTDSAGDPSKPSIIFIAGSLSSSIVFDKQFEDPELKKNLHLVRYDLRGQGLSERPSMRPHYWTSKKFADDFKAVVGAYNLTKPFIAAWSNAGAILADMMAHIDSECYSGVIFLSSAPFWSWGREVMSDMWQRMCPIVLSPYTSDLCSTVNELFEASTHHPEKVPPMTKLAWIGVYALQHPEARVYYLCRQQDADGFSNMARSISVMVILGEEDKFLKSMKLKGLYEETFGSRKSAEVQTWSGVGHLPFFEEPEKTRDAILAFVKRVQLSSEPPANFGLRTRPLFGSCGPSANA